MKLLPTHKCTPEQYNVITLTETVLNSVDFKGFIWRTKFTELGDLQDCSGQDLYNKFFVNDEYHFSWKVVPRPWYKRLSSVVGYTVGTNIFTYEPRYKAMTIPEKAGHLAHELMHILGFSHSVQDCPERARSLPYQVGDYVETAVKLMTK
jgi:hypothetical protein